MPAVAHPLNPQLPHLALELLAAYLASAQTREYSSLTSLTQIGEIEGVAIWAAFTTEKDVAQHFRGNATHVLIRFQVGGPAGELVQQGLTISPSVNMFTSQEIYLKRALNRLHVAMQEPA